MKKFVVKIGEFNKEMTEEQIKARFEKFMEDPLTYGMTFYVKCIEQDGLYAANEGF